MTSVIQSPYTSEQIAAWLRGLLTIAWADGDFNEQEQKVIASLTQDELAPETDLGAMESINPEELAAAFDQDSHAAENFLRTAVMVALADGVYTDSEDNLLRQFFQALGQQPIMLEGLQHTLYDPGQKSQPAELSARLNARQVSAKLHPSVLRPVRVWLDKLEIHDPRVARFLCKMIPSQCPFERDIKLFDHKVVHIPPLCKLNPLYEQLVGLRFCALSYLADDCQEDVSQYC